MNPREELIKQIEVIDTKLDRLLSRGANDEKLVTKKRKLQDELRRLEAGESA